MNKNSRNYWEDFSPIWWEEIKNWFGWTDWLNAVIKTGIQIGSVFLVFFLGGNAESFLDSVLVTVAEWILIIALFSFVLTITYLRASRKLYDKQKDIQNEQNRKISKLQRITSTKTIKTEKIKFIPKEEFAKSARDLNSDHYAYLEILNGEDDDLKDCFANLEVFKIRYSDQEEWTDWLRWMDGNTRFLTWPNFNTARDEKIIRRKKTDRINIAKMKSKGYPVFIFGDGKEERMSAEQIYIEVSLNGKINDKQIDEIIFRGFVQYKQGFYIQEGATITTTQNGVSKTIVEPSENIPEWRVYIIPGELDS